MSDSDVFEHLSHNLRRQARNAFISARKAHDAVLDSESDNDEQKALAGTVYLNKAIAEMATVKAIYFSCYEQLAHYDIEEVFLAFEVFANEMAENISTEHSHQWTDIEYIKYTEAYEASVLSTPDH